MEINKKYIIDLSDAKTPADVVFNLCNEMEKPESSNQNVWLKLGDISLNQSQILSINSLISSINSTLSVIESDSAETKSSAEILGFSTKIEEELKANIPEAPVNTEDEKPVEQYIPMSDHLDIEKTTQDEQEENVLDTKFSVFDELKMEILEEKKSLTEKTEDNIEKETVSDDESNLDVDNKVGEENASVELENKEDSDLQQSNDVKSLEDKSEENVEISYKSEPDEEIQEHLDSIFDSETKLENILNDESDIISTKNWPLTKEADEFEIPDEVMTDEDYAILQMGTQYHKQTVRSGQVIQSNGNVVIIGDCHPGCEIHAAGDITVWGVLGGIAHAGCKGNTKARIRALNLNAIQLRIAESYARRPDHIKNIYNEKTNTFTPEEARNINGSIVILKINDN